MIFYLSFYHYLDICVIWSLGTDNQSMASVFIQIVLLIVHLYHLWSYELHPFVQSCSLIEVNGNTFGKLKLCQNIYILSFSLFVCWRDIYLQL
jgi:hypothetical protein